MIPVTIERMKAAFPRFAEGLAAGQGEIEHVLPPASEVEIEKLEKELGVPLPGSYKELLRITRGFWLFGGVIQLGSQHPFFHDFPALEVLTPRQRQTLTQKGGHWPPPSQGMLCFAECFLEADGDQVLFDVHSGVGGEYPVMYYGHEDHPPSVRQLAPDFRSFLEGLWDLPELQDEDVE